jgi:hypothetical protein
MPGGGHASPPCFTAAWIVWRHAALLGPRGQDASCFRFVALFCGLLALEGMDWLGLVGPVIGRVGDSDVYPGPAPQVLARLAPGGPPPPDVTGPGAVIGSRP